MCSSAIMHSWLQYLAPHIAHWCPSNGRLQRLRVLNKSRFGLLSARVMFNHCSIAQCSCDPSCLLLQLLHTPWFDTPRTPIFVDASLTFKRTTALLFHCHHCFLGYNSIQFNSTQFDSIQFNSIQFNRPCDLAGPCGALAHPRGHQLCNAQPPEGTPTKNLPSAPTRTMQPRVALAIGHRGGCS